MPVHVSCATTTTNACIVCKFGWHPLYVCKEFCNLVPKRRTSIASKKEVCLYCLKPGLFHIHCSSNQKCRKCHKSHHTLLHLLETSNQALSSPKKATKMEMITTTHTRPATSNRQTLLMICKVQVKTANGHTTTAIALFDSASSVSFISKQLAQHLRLLHKRKTQINTGIGGTTPQWGNKSFAHFRTPRTNSKAKTIDVEAVVLPKDTDDLLPLLVYIKNKWNHLKGLASADMAPLAESTFC